MTAPVDELSDVKQTPAPRPTITAALAGVSSFYGVSFDALLGPSRGRRVALPRQVAMWLARQSGQYSLPRIGAVIGNRHHTTVLAGIRAVQRRRERSAPFRAETDGLLRRLREGA